MRVHARWLVRDELPRETGREWGSRTEQGTISGKGPQRVAPAWSCKGSSKVHTAPSHLKAWKLGFLFPTSTTYRG